MTNGNWRIHNNEKSLSDSLLLAWEIVLPERFIPIIDQDIVTVNRVDKQLLSLFTEKELKNAADRARKRLNLIE